MIDLRVRCFGFGVILASAGTAIQIGALMVGAIAVAIVAAGVSVVGAGIVALTLLRE